MILKSGIQEDHGRRFRMKSEQLYRIVIIRDLDVIRILNVFHIGILVLAVV
jgi:hypothetical protein